MGNRQSPRKKAAGDAPGICAHCELGNRPRAVLLPIGAVREKGGLLAWVHDLCYAPWLANRRSAGALDDAGGAGRDDKQDGTPGDIIYEDH